MSKSKRLFVINPGSTSTKLAVFDGTQPRQIQAVQHPADQLAEYQHISDQLEFRLNAIRRFLSENNIPLNTLDAVVGRGGLLKPLDGGVYPVNRAMLEDLTTCKYGEHASNLGAIIANKIASDAGCPAYIVDPVVVDEMDAVARLSGMPDIERISIFHALNHKSVAREVAAGLEKRYEDCNFIIAHLGGGISVGAHLKGRVVDVNNALGGDGAFSPERAGGLPVFQLLDLAYSGRYTLSELKKKIVGGGGLVGYIGTNNLIDAMRAIENGDTGAALAVDAMAYQISREIASHGATLKGDIDRIILTGGLAHNDAFVSKITERVAFLADVIVIPGENEMVALARGVMAVINHKQTPKEYKS